ncbi:lipoyl(octanoyl) transferase LipB [Pseudochryseolinea flava]|uniref:Octanoyltransferase n=1 Tax=Pseudochryseolinea flava TaxID=2059302 RepID=A0A364Y9I1_9BACT|nr:lipoyl(octanoyl) transferase LipB [Pseudochryseolinea flava]RAW03029.1 lipoyl(octanoyl) transferase [Pseudochryseolinea flava]
MTDLALNKKTTYENLGLIDYKKAWDYQTSLFEKILAIKSANRDLPVDQHQQTENYLLFCQHPHVYTLGKSGKEQNLLVKVDDLHAIDATYYHINRGGDITYHGPGQLVVYPVIDMENFFTDIHKYMRLLEEAVIQTCSRYNISAGRIKGLTGVWVDFENEKTARKICAMGVKTSRWVTMHGLALNVNTNLEYFKTIVPCGIEDKAVTSIGQEVGHAIDFAEVENELKKNIVHCFGMELL